MDYKIIILLLALLFLIILIYREVTTLKTDVVHNVSGLAHEMRTYQHNMVGQFQSNINKCVSQIKNISSDNLQQLRKITLLNNQPVTRIANHFTETDDSEMRTNINYLSETRKLKGGADLVSDQKNGEKHSSLYMSEDSENKSKNKNKGMICTGDICIINKSEENTDIPLYVGKDDNVKSKPMMIIDDDSQSSNSNNSQVSNKNSDVDDDSTDSLDNKSESDDESLHENKQTLIEEEESSDKSNKKEINNCINYPKKDEIEINISTMMSPNNFFQNMSHDDLTTLIKKSEQKEDDEDTSSNSIPELNKDQDEDSISVDKSAGEIDVSEQINNISRRPSEVSIENVLIKSTNLDSTTNSDGSSDNNEPAAPKITVSIKKRKGGANKIASVKINTNGLDKIEKYNLEQLKKLASFHSVPISYIDESKKRKIYKKDELYNNIKQAIQKKSKEE